ncbi:phytanoyl-CoA dioxygenase [Candidatus Poribacteria bacterium]|nr:phytanoyl-CoA dioxygenase [Candidatus Poribacteria bacterium]
MILPMGNRELELGGEHLGHLRESKDIQGDMPALRARLSEDGYLLLRGLHDVESVNAARRVVLADLDAREQIDRSHPRDEGVIAEAGRGAFLGGRKAVTHTDEFLSVVEAPRLMEFFTGLFDGESLAYDYKWLRAVPTGASTGAHYDVVYMGRGSLDLVTLWTPLGDVSYDMGPLAVLDGPRGMAEVRSTYGKMDVDRDHVTGSFSDDPLALIEQYGGQWLTTEFEIGDALIFGMFAMHGSLTNTTLRYRLSADTRYQRADQPVDERWMGNEPIAHYAWTKGETVTMDEARQRWGV